MRNLSEKLGRFFEYLENLNFSLYYFVLVFFLAVNVRNFLEIFSFETLHDFGLQTLIHYNLFYTAMAMTFIAFFSLAAKNDVAKTAKVVLTVFLVVVLPPILDLLISGGKGYNMSYLLPDVHDGLVRRFFTFFGPMERPPGFQVLIGVTPGIKIEIAAVLFASLFYFYEKRKNIFKSLVFTFFVYSIFFFYSAFPFVLKKIDNFASLAFFPNISEDAIAELYPAIILLSGITVAFLVKPVFFASFARKFQFISQKNILTIAKDFRLTRFLYYFLMIILGVAFGVSQGGTLISEKYTDIVLVFFALAFAVVFSIITNNIADVGIDRISNVSRPLVRGEIQVGEYKKLAWLFLGLAFLCAWWAGITSLFFIALFVGIYFLYSMPPFRFKRVTFFSKLAISLNSLILVVAGWEIASGKIEGFPFYIWPYFLFGITAAANFIDLKDFEGDKSAGIRTLPVVLGPRRAKLLIGIFFVAAYFSFYWMLQQKLEGLGWPLFFAALAALQFFFINRKKYKEQPIFVVILFTLAVIIWSLVK